MIPYGLAVPIIFWYFVLRMWARYGPGMPLVFVGLWVVAMFGFPLLHLPGLASSLSVIGLAIAMVLIDKYRSPIPLRRSAQW